MNSDKQLRLGLLIHPTGNHVASWFHPDAQIDAGSNFPHYVELAQMAEAAKFDLLFLADALAVREGDPKVLARWPQYMAYFEPTTLLAGIAARTKHIGLVATSSTSYNEPYNIARRYASLDHISGGRAGWNVVTSASQNEALNFNRSEHYEHADRYARAREFVEVAKKLWDSWEDDAFVRDRTSGEYFDANKLHAAEHKGTFFSVQGPLNIGRPPQGHPVLAQAGSSEAGKELAAASAEIVFVALQSLADGRKFYDDLKARMAKYGRERDTLKIMSGLNPIVGHTEKEAMDKQDYLQSLIHPDVGRELLSNALGGISLHGFDADEPLPYHLIPTDTNNSKSGLQHVLTMAKRDNLTIRQLYNRFGGARGQRTVIGTPIQIADQMEEWFVNQCVDGFLIQPSHFPGGLADFVEMVIPELQRRGLFRREYRGTSLRDNLGLPRPVNRYAR
jgi:FMN-dependent oxidoreductase (nitrilotriacetate monooxygenase family)